MFCHHICPSGLSCESPWRFVTSLIDSWRPLRIYSYSGVCDLFWNVSSIIVPRCLSSDSLMLLENHSLKSCSEDSDESTHKILSNGLLFSLFYHFPYTIYPPTCTMPTRPSVTFVWSPLTIPYTHPTIGPVPHRRPPIWPTDHVILSFLSLFSFTQCILSWPNQSQVTAPHSQDFTICFAAYEPCAHFTYCLYLRLLHLLQKRRKFSPELRLEFISSYHFTSLHLTPLFYFALSTHFALSNHTEPLSPTTSHSLILHQSGVL